MMPKRRSRSRTARLALLIALPAVALTTACGGAGSSDEGVASVRDAPSTSQSKDDADGSKGGGAQGKSAFYDAQMKFVQCMRREVDKNYPDPKVSGHIDWEKVDELSMDEAKRARALNKGGTCAEESKNAEKLEPPRDQQKSYESMLAHAKCMRANGVSKFTNPKLQDGNAIPGGDPNPVSPEISLDSPAYKQARHACKDKLLDGLDGMQ
ncbi:hypothetical protein [Streptomyces sp. NPDC048637]|uniref:hypothetical protein n=1 Tax=Streptomyces sp. NPDC048637 TaxID=3155636 RepID=UPI003437AFE3